MPESEHAAHLEVHRSGANLLVTLSGSWLAQSGLPGIEAIEKELAAEPDPVRMKKVFRLLGWMFLILGLALDLLGALALPDGGLMFALPYFFLIPGITLTAIGGFMLLLARPRKTNSGDRQ